jgi:hypothetical protein
MATSKKAAKAANETLGTTPRKTPARGLAQPSVKRGTTRMPRKRAAPSALGFQSSSRLSPSTLRQRPLPESVDEETIARLVAEAEEGIPAEKLRRRGRPAIGVDAASTYSVRLPDDLVTLVDERSEIDGVTRGETIRRALIEYLTN